MKRFSFLAALVVVLVVSQSSAMAQYGWDTNTVLLEHFDGTISGEGFGQISYVPSLPKLTSAVDLKQGSWVKYTLPGWDQYSGTMEMWVYPREYSICLGHMQWFNTNSPPASGYIGYLYISGDGKLGWNSWPCGAPPQGNSIIPLNQWTHMAYTWCPGGSRLYVNGVLDSFSPGNYYPALWNPTYFYLNNWGQYDLGYVDELRISKIARTAEEIGAHVASILVRTVEIDIKPSINLKSNGVIPVAILTTKDFDATSVNGATVTFGPSSAKEVHGEGHLEDANSDSKLDWVGHFKTQETGLKDTDKEATINGKTKDGKEFTGKDSINIVGGPKKAPSLNPELTITWGKIKNN